MESTYFITTHAYNKGYHFHISSPSNKYIIKSVSLPKSWYTPEELLLVVKEYNNAQDKLYTQYILLKRKDTNIYEPSSLTPFYSYNLLEQREFFLSFRAIDGKYRGDIHVNEFQLIVST